MKINLIICAVLALAAAPAIAQQVFDPAGAVSDTALQATAGKADLG